MTSELRVLALRNETIWSRCLWYPAAPSGKDLKNSFGIKWRESNTHIITNLAT